jgi:hypothetical protein
MANNFNYRQRVIIEVPEEYTAQNNQGLKLGNEAVHLITEGLAGHNYQVQVHNGTFIIRQNNRLVGDIRQRRMRQGYNPHVPGGPVGRMQYRNALMLDIEVPDNNDRDTVENVIRQVLGIGPRINLGNYPLQGTPEPGNFGGPGPNAGPNAMVLDGGKKRRRHTKLKSRKHHTKKHRKTHRRR